MASTEPEFNPFLPEFHANPYPFYHRLRATDPVHRTPMSLWVLTRYDDVVSVLRDPRFGREEFAQILANVYGEGARSMLFRDPPDHTRLRGLVSQAFTPRVIERMRSHIQNIVDRLLDAQPAAGNINFRVTGTQSPSVIFVHGFTCALEDWDAQVKALSPKFRCAALDLPGHGASAKPANVSIASMAAAVNQVKDRVGPGGKILVGHSMGCRVITEAYVRSRADVVGLV